MDNYEEVFKEDQGPFRCGQDMVPHQRRDQREERQHHKVEPEARLRHTWRVFFVYGQREAAAILKVQEATAQALKLRNEAAPSDQVVKLKALEAFQAAADGKATKLIIPSEIQGLAGLAAIAEPIGKYKYRRRRDWGRRGLRLDGILVMGQKSVVIQLSSVPGPEFFVKFTRKFGKRRDAFSSPAADNKIVTASAKTTASRILAEGLTRNGNRAVRISLDDFYKDRVDAPLWEDGQKAV